MFKNHKHSYTPVIYKQSQIMIDSNSQLLQQEYTTNKGCEGLLQGELQTTAQGNNRGHKQMEKYSMLMVRKNQYCENGQTAQSNS